ncbi:hypothetical protein ACLKA6_015696 [Drosophila palustris]
MLVLLLLLLLVLEETNYGFPSPPPDITPGRPFAWPRRLSRLLANVARGLMKTWRLLLQQQQQPPCLSLPPPTSPLPAGTIIVVIVVVVIIGSLSPVLALRRCRARVAFVIRAFDKLDGKPNP